MLTRWTEGGAKDLADVHSSTNTFLLSQNVLSMLSIGDA